jgi:hypothetical protein
MRGGNWTNQSPEIFLAATRMGTSLDWVGSTQGFRLVARPR